MRHEKIIQMEFGRVYGLLMDKALRKGRTEAEVDAIISWLTGYSADQIRRAAAVPYGDFFRQAPAPNPDRVLIKGTVCGVRVEEVEDPLLREIRYLDKLIDELARGRPLEKILRKPGESPLWTCPRCGRSFRHREQDHYCGEAPKTIADYIAAQPEAVQDRLRQVNAAVRAGLPEAAEKISWSMPTYWRGRNLIQFAASKTHIGLYPGPEAVAAFAPQLSDYPTSKGAIQLPHGKPLPLKLITAIARWCGENP